MLKHPFWLFSARAVICGKTRNVFEHLGLEFAKHSTKDHGIWSPLTRAAFSPQAVLLSMENPYCKATGVQDDYCLADG